MKIFLLSVLALVIFAQPRGMVAGRDAITGPFKGVTTKGELQPGLFKIKSTGVSTDPVRRAADAFLAGLSDAQRQKTLFPVDDLEWQLWDNRHFAPRQGVGFAEMDPKQRDLAFGLLGAALSAKGLKLTQDIMKLNGTLAELTQDSRQYGEWLYWITIMGKPSAKEPWGFQLDGHHVIINYFVLGDQVVMTPVFMGSEPIRAEGGKFQGTVVLQPEQEQGLALIKALDAAQQSAARIQGPKGSTNNLAEAYKDNLVLDYAGLPAAKMTGAQKKLLRGLINEYVGNMAEPHRRVRMEEIDKHLDATYFAWIGDAQPPKVFYYRIHSPVVLIEFDHQGPIALSRDRTPTRNHIHTVVRTPNGNDYGKDLLRQHYAMNRH
ncbi:MAG: DUF3500 domain-containing protein [Bryobacteraceae bacterium]|nr:DUF3500 domain-containing protein [Bryobacteraceae bacterium]